MREQATKIRHTVAFTLSHARGSKEERQFLEDGNRILSVISGVERFEVLRQVSVKNPYAFGFSMEFADQSAYNIYNEHTDHVHFVEERWKKEVVDFLEADFIIIQANN